MHRPQSDMRAHIPLGRWKFGRLLWVVAVALCLSAVVLPAGIFLKSTSVSSRHSFTGSLRPLAAPVSVFLPEGAFLKEILIERNETVYAGQTVALLDEEAIFDRLSRLDARLLHDEVLRSCLLYGPELDQGFLNSQPADTAEKVSVKEAKAACAAAWESDENVKNAFNAALGLIETDQGLLDKYLRVLVENPVEDFEYGDDAVRQVLSLQIAQNRLLQRKLSLEQEAQSSRRDRHASRVLRLEKLAEEMQINAELRRRLNSLVEQPRLLAPENGQVVRLRRFPVGTAALEDTEFVEIRPSDSRGYKAFFTVPQDHRGFLKQGQTVIIELVGMGARAPRLFGVLEGFEVGAQNVLFGSIALQSESVLALDDPSNGIALRGDSTAAVIHIQFEGYNAFAKVSEALVDALAVFGIAAPDEQKMTLKSAEGTKELRFAQEFPEQIGLVEIQ